jgi:hypothetical protein
MIGDGVAAPHHFQIEIRVTCPAQRQGAAIAIFRVACILLACHNPPSDQGVQRQRGRAAASPFRALGILAKLRCLRCINALKPNRPPANLERIPVAYRGLADDRRHGGLSVIKLLLGRCLSGCAEEAKQRTDQRRCHIFHNRDPQS